MWSTWSRPPSLAPKHVSLSRRPMLDQVEQHPARSQVVLNPRQAFVAFDRLGNLPRVLQLAEERLDAWALVVALSLGLDRLTTTLGPRDSIPDLHCEVAGRRCELRPVGAETKGLDVRGMTPQLVNGLPRVRVPENAAVVVAAKDVLAVEAYVLGVRRTFAKVQTPGCTTRRWAGRALARRAGPQVSSRAESPPPLPRPAKRLRGPPPSARSCRARMIPARVRRGRSADAHVGAGSGLPGARRT
ncbi:MAG: hypothetical protein ACI8Y8_001937 [Planctomycetota bacterium]|jgi:hypothetical protein